jgi:hypothetical protein
VPKPKPLEMEGEYYPCGCWLTEVGAAWVTFGCKDHGDSWVMKPTTDSFAKSADARSDEEDDK